MPVLVALAAVVSTALGGLFALRHRDQLHHILGFTAGVILGVVLFDVLPEIDELSAKTGLGFRTVMIALAASFLTFHGMEKWLLVHNAHEHEYAGHHHPQVGLASALALAGHSLAGGLAAGARRGDTARRRRAHPAVLGAGPRAARLSRCVRRLPSLHRRQRHPP